MSRVKVHKPRMKWLRKKTSRADVAEYIALRDSRVNSQPMGMLTLESSLTGKWP